MNARTLRRLVSDTERSLSIKKDVVVQKVDDMSKEGKVKIAELKSLPPTEALKAFFDRIPLRCIPGIGSSEVVEVQAVQTIEEAIRLLCENDVLGAPVVDKPVSSQLGQPLIEQYVGLVDLGSMILWALEEIEVAEPQAKVRGLIVEADSDHESSEIAISKDDFLSLLRRLEDIGSSKVGALARSFRWGPFLPVYPHSSLLHVLLSLSTHSLKAVPVVDVSGNKVTGFVTQDAVMQLLLQCSGLPWFDQIAEKRLHHFRFESDQPHGKLVYILGDRPLMEAFHCLWRFRVTAVPVLHSETNRLIGCVRTADARILLDNQEVFKRRRTLSVEEFMASDKREARHGRTRLSLEERIGTGVSAAALSLGSFELPPMLEPVTSLGTDTLKETISKVVASRCDRSFLINDEMELIGVITLRDVILQFAPPLGEEPDCWKDMFDNAL